MTYPTTAHTDLAAIEANLAGIRARVGTRLVLAAVKANGYGHGAVAVSRHCERTGAADWLGVATTEEGVELREAGITLPILKLSPARGDEVPAALAAGITLPVVDAASVTEIADAAVQLGLSGVNVHLKLDTGMRRVGAEPDQAVALAKAIDATGRLDLQGLFSHLPISDAPAGKAFTEHQIARFTETIRTVEEARGPVPLKHLANSGGVLDHPESWFDLVRPGIMIYGSYPDPETSHSVQLTEALRWTTRVSYLKRVPAGETVGYGRTWSAPEPRWIATIPVGYGDGYSRLLSNRGRVLINGHAHPIAGRVCMDQTMIDLGPEPSAKVGDEVVLIGSSGAERISVAEVAGLMGTIPYEVSCLITNRVTRTH
ncbi:MAG: alanine racemase [Micropruina sp.]